MYNNKRFYGKEKNMDINNKFLKKAVSVAVSSALLMNSSAVIFAQEEQPLSVIEPEEVVSSAETGFTSDELLLGYFENKLYGADASGAATFALGNSSSFEGKSKEIYDGLKTLAESVAAGTQASTAHTFTFSYTLEQLGLGETPTDEQFKAALDAEIAKYNMPTVVGCLIRDCPYEFYWYGNTYTYGYSTQSSGSDVTMEFTVSFTVGNTYAGNEEYTVDTVKTSAAAAAADGAENIVWAAKNDYDSLYDRLLFYKQEICNLVSYDTAAAESLGSGTIDDGNPWQVIYVFDGDTSTNVVCEGYAKAFQYLCDLDGGIDCYCVSGDMQVNAEDAEPHMWNIVSIDGANYLVDITNCDEGSIGDPSELFLVGMGTIDDKYTKSIGTDNVHYEYDDYTKQYFSESILKISEKNYEIVGGECGEKAKWKLEGGTLTIYGEGDVKIENRYKAPWYSYFGVITAVVIEDGITSVPAEAFAVNYRYIKTLTIASTVTSIGDYAFQTCTSLESVIFSGESQLTSIGTFAFEACEALKSIEIPKSVATIGKNGFSSCIKLETVTFDDESKLTVLDNTFSVCSALKSINIPKSVTNIGDNTFAECSSLETINIPKSVTNIGNYAFSYCSSLSEVTINSKEMEFGFIPFNNINIKTLNIPCSTLTPEEITEFFGDSVTVNYKHDIKYSASGSAISCVCSDCSDEGTAEVKAEKAVYDGKAHEATVTKTGMLADAEILVTYAVKGGEKLESAPVAAGDYTASITYGEYTASVDYTIEKATPVVEVKANPSSYIAGKTITVTATAKNPENEALTDVPALVLTYKVGENGTETEFVDSFVIPEGTAIGSEIIVTAKTAASDNYNAATAKVVVAECKHTDKTTAWTTDETNHWHICNLCNAEVDKAAHISDSGKITTPPTVITNGVKTYSCIECGYVIKTEAIPATSGEGESAPAVTTPAYTGRPSWVTTPAAVTTTVTTTTTTTTTTSAPADENEEVKVEDDTDTTRPADDENQPQIKGENGKQGWEVIEDEISDANDGDKIVIDMNGADEVPKDIFKAIKGMDIELVIELGNGFTWTINGEDVTKPIAVNLGIGDEENIPVDIIIKVAGECGYETFAINHDGDFGFTATLTVDLGEENEGYYANLYWYTNGGMEFICADKINSKGKADLKFTHASEYIIVIDEENHGKRAEVSEEAEESEDTDDTDVDEKSDDVIVTDEDDDMNPATGVAISFAGIAISAAAVLLAKKRNK